MKNRIVSLFCMGMLLFLSGCSVTASLNPPFDKRAETSPEPFLGEWICSTKTDTYAIRLSPLQGTGHAVRIRIQQTPRTPKERFRGTWIPLNGIFQTIRGEIFLIVAPATGEMLREADRNEQAGWLLAPLFHVLKLNPEKEGNTLRFVTFADPPESGRKWPPVDKAVHLQERIVLNSTDSLMQLLNNGAYKLDSNCFLLIRKEEKETPR